MKFFAAASALALALSATARPLDERQNGIVYLQQKTNIASRLEIRQLHDTAPNQYNLYIISMARWQAQSQNSPTSYGGVASIHGVPRQNYNNVGQCSSCGNTDGYAVHDSVLFPPWHRAYIGLFEQELTRIARQVAQEYPKAQRATMQKAANALRVPFYDAGAMPAPGSPAFPNLMTDFTVVVNGPKGRTSLRNPLFRYDIQNPSGFVYPYFTSWRQTLRYPTSNAQDASSNTAASKNALANLRQSLADQFYGLFANCHSWLQFSNDRAGSSSPGCATSVEDIHNAIHTAIGGTGNSQTGLSAGHMTYLPLSSFDPSFWLHHSNIDRMFAFWQTLNPNAWGDSQAQPTTSWTIAQGTVVNAGSALTPFMRQTGGTNPGNFWTSNGVRNWRNLGYTYPEYRDSDGSAQSITNYINRLYGPNANQVVGTTKRDLMTDLTNSVDDVIQSTTSDTPDNTPTDSLTGTIGAIINETAGAVTSTAQSLTGVLPIAPGSALAATNGSVYQYVANIFTPRYLLNGTYQIYLFNGQPSTDDNSQWIFQDNLIGMMGVLSKPGMTDNDLMASGSIPLTRTLQSLTPGMAASPLLQDLTEALVVPFLQNNLVWRIAGPAGEVDPASIPGFVLSIYASTAPQVADDALPLWSDFIPLLDATAGKSGGASTTEHLVPPQQDRNLVPSSIPSYSS